MSKRAIIRIRLYNGTRELKRALINAIASHLGQGSEQVQYYLEDKSFFQFCHDYSSYAINYEDIIFFEKQGRQIRLHSTRGDFFFNETMSALERKLEPYQFFRAHQGLIVNVVKIRAYMNLNLFIDPDDTQIRISRRQEKKLLDLLNHSHFIQRVQWD